MPKPFCSDKINACLKFFKTTEVMLHKSRKIFLTFLLIPFLFQCKEKDSNNNLFAGLGFGNPVITSIEPSAGSPPQADGVSYTGTQITIKGRNFTPNSTDTIVKFNGLAGTIFSITTTEIITTVPTGATAGFLTVSKADGFCDTVNGTDGYNCSARRFYVDCYKAYSNIYGDETAINYPDSQTVKFTDNYSTKAFRSNLKEVGETILTFECDNLVTVKYFSKNCTTNTIGTFDAPVYNPIINFTENYAVQYFITTGKGSCKIGFR
ncbi:IPT/TIG domain-containing protein [Leptospira weilii]|uniref:IPT/TIG domain protein n=2 Tax=Leptospira weilii TaxID=28184 RepID=M6G6I8_9LEPT|nr:MULTISPECIES: IPT/TIG domain-containing protein [Leptospira]EMM74541.1 IPT/TIG domain protein [Leptospira weilii str. 2006001855]EMJ65582.1 IPT/TIG domain protein [Leptospira sp. P2653]MCL8266152.1 IPT/TIG domain-containing protein [Leptospira weilii]MDL5246074.1 IPT/TIG domain-containing protein [Leptospira weilii]OMI18455.1 DNA-binding protein [Leptospira weilii serovar Heyan]